MKQSKIIITVGASLMLLGAGCWRTTTTPAPVVNNPTITTVSSSITSTDTSSDTNEDGFDTPETMATKNVRKVSLGAYDTVVSPLVVTGEAEGWYFEGSFPVELQDAAGKVLATGIAQAQSDWAVAEYVAFKIEIPFKVTTPTAGMLVLKKDNPSGLAQYDETIRLPVLLKP